MSSNSIVTELSDQQDSLGRYDFYRPGRRRSSPGTVLYVAPRSDCVPGAITRREWLRFLGRVALGPSCSCHPTPHICWPWTHHLYNPGYGKFGWRGRQYIASLFACIALGIPIDRGMQPHQRCTTSGCTNPVCFGVRPASRSMKRPRGPQGPLINPYGTGPRCEPRSALQPGAITRREWMRFFLKIEIGDVCLCRPEKPHSHWLWMGAIRADGYGQFGWRGLNYKAHRFAFIALRDAIPSDREPDHLCRIRHCVNPDCLEPVTRLENVRRGKNGHKTHCPAGHLYSEETLILNRWKKGEKACRICKNAQDRERYHRMKHGE